MKIVIIQHSKRRRTPRKNKTNVAKSLVQEFDAVETGENLNETMNVNENKFDIDTIITKTHNVLKTCKEIHTEFKVLWMSNVRL